jgi:hypothetical protein
MKIKIFIIASIIIQSSWAQVEKGYEKSEACDMIAICNSFTFLDLYNSDDQIIPNNYNKVYSSSVIGMDNKFQIYRNGKTAVIHIRGSTSNKQSWLENFYSLMIPATGVIQIFGKPHEYCFSKKDNAAVHSGYALGITYLSNEIIPQILILNKDNIYDIIITGHSQGGALAQLLMAYLKNLPEERISSKNNFKTYAFASPMVGNDEFANEYSTKYCNGNSFNIINAADIVPSFPLSYNDSSFISKTDLHKFVFEYDSLDLKHILVDGTIRLVQKPLSKVIFGLGRSVFKQIEKIKGEIIMPEYTTDINYTILDELIKIPPYEYPKQLKDSTILFNDSLMAIYKKGDDGHFIDETLYKPKPLFFQHKSYNYYLSLMKMYFPKSYENIELKELPKRRRN